MPQRLGQHFLKNSSIITKMIDSLHLEPNMVVFEIGPGQGILTLPLSKHCQINESQLISIEKDRRLAVSMHKKELPNTEIVLGDALVELPKRAQQLKNGQKYSIIGNIPYYITGYLLRTVGELSVHPNQCVFMVQKEVAERAASSAPHFNKLAASVGFWADARITQFVGRREFTPPPAVDSAILLLTTKPETYSIDQRSAYYRAVQAIFQQPRKTLANNLVEGIAKNHSLTSKPLLRERVLQFFEMHGLQPDARPQNLTVADVFAISQTFFT